MTDTPQPVAGSLQARIIRACPTHADCALECPERKVEELGEIASFDTRDVSHDPNIIARLREAYTRWHQGGPRT